MKTQALIAGTLVAVLNGAGLVPELRPYAAYLMAASALAGLWLIARAWAHRPTESASAAASAPIRRSAPPPPEPAGHREEAAVVTLLSIFQEKGRLVDFLMDDITPYQDAQVGAAARVVHQGLRPALLEHFEISPIAGEAEGARVTVPAEAPAGHYRLTGKLTGDGPFSGTLVHRGWKADAVKLPRLIDDGQTLPPLAPAQVDVK